ncbi:MAG: hypothetical protein HFH60_05490 [Lachnospiraceae bacterium]|nr:hypothetical protein [Lachnospiraceae bacterium]
MDEKGILVEIMKKLQKKYGNMNEVLRVTQEMQDALSRDDRVSMEMLLSMRQKDIDLAADCDGDIRYLLSVLTPEKREQTREWLNHGTAKEEDGFEAVKISEIAGSIRNVLDKTIQVDSRMSRRVAGKDSFYK